MLDMTESFPRQEARTRRFTLGVPRSFRISPDGARVAYLRTKGGNDPVTCLWMLDVGSGQKSGWSRTRGRWAATSGTCRRRSGLVGSGSGSRPAASWPTPPTRT